MELLAAPLAASLERSALASLAALTERTAPAPRVASVERAEPGSGSTRGGRWAPARHDTPRIRLGIDLCGIERVAESLARFGSRYLERVYTPGEAAYAMASPALAPERLAARFAAKEAAMKAFGLGERGVAWTAIEVVRAADGACTLALHGRAAEAAGLASGSDVAVSLTHDDGHAAAVVLALA